MIVVSDTSALSALFLIDQLEILPALYERVVIPPAVFHEFLQLESQFGHEIGRGVMFHTDFWIMSDKMGASCWPRECRPSGVS